MLYSFQGGNDGGFPKSKGGMVLNGEGSFTAPPMSAAQAAKARSSSDEPGVGETQEVVHGELSLEMGASNRELSMSDNGFVLLDSPQLFVRCSRLTTPEILRHNILRNLYSVLLHYLVTVKQQNNKTKGN